MKTPNCILVLNWDVYVTETVKWWKKYLLMTFLQLKRILLAEQQLFVHVCKDEHKMIAVPTVWQIIVLATVKISGIVL